MKEHFAPRHLQLDAGESLFFHTKAGSALISTSGTLLVTGTPRWLGEQVFRASTALEPGQSHTVVQSGWITVTAQHGGAACVLDTAWAKAPGRTGNVLLRYFSGMTRGVRAWLGRVEAI
ncbi:hypothetical protein [Polaromonas aquatica]|uniref:hypothetical protein n=1 Tax=Polaromonas aquatica TaxID=332657 RepID=UPI003D654304